MSDFDFKSATSLLEAKPIFEVEMKTDDVTRMIDALGFTLNSIGRSPLSAAPKGELESIAKNAVAVAKDLLWANVYTANNLLDRNDRRQTFNLLESVQWRRNSNNQIQFFADAKSPNGYLYAGSIEYGFHPGGGATYVPPRPFLRPALEFAANATRSSLENNIRQLIYNYQNNNFAFNHFGPSTTVGTSHRIWGLTSGTRFNAFNRQQKGTINNALIRGQKSGNYNKWTQQQRYGTRKGAWKNKK